MSSGKRNLGFDIILAVAFVIAIVSGLMMGAIATLGLTSPVLRTTLHSWQHIHGLTTTLVLIGVIVHLLWHWKWIKAAFRPGVKSPQVRLNRRLDGLLFITFGLVMLSGLHSHVEGHATGILLARVNSVQVDPFHLLTVVALLLSVLFHQVLHWKWIMATTQRSLGLKILQKGRV